MKERNLLNDLLPYMAQFDETEQTWYDHHNIEKPRDSDKLYPRNQGYDERERIQRFTQDYLYVMR